MVQHGAYLDMRVQSGHTTFRGLLEMRYGILLKEIICENAYRCYHGTSFYITASAMWLLNGFNNFKGDLQVLKMCHDAGFKFQGILQMDEIQISEFPDEKQEVVRNMQRLPTLKSLCRVAIRHTLGSPLSKIISSLCLPGLINEYLMFYKDSVQATDESDEIIDDVYIGSDESDTDSGEDYIWESEVF